jgi:alpha-glucosidase
VHAIHRNIRRVMNDYPEAVTIGEVWVFDNASWAEYLRADELHLGFNFRMVRAEFDITEIYGSIENTLDAAALENATPTWTLENHDVVRAPSRYGGGTVGLDRARAMALVTLALPGAVFLYNGQELGLANVELPDEALRDPTWERSGHTVRGRDGCRIPIPWRGDTPPFGFSTSIDTWLPMPPEWQSLTVERQLLNAESTLSFFQHALELRRSRIEFAGDSIVWLDVPRGALAFARGDDGLHCALNTGSQPIPLPYGEPILTSAPLVDGELPPNAAAWLVSSSNR